MNKSRILLISILSFQISVFAQNQMRVDYWGEPFAEDILNNKWKWADFPKPTDNKPNFEGFATERLGKLPKAGIHPRILFSPEQVPQIRKRIEKTQVGKVFQANLNKRFDIFQNKAFWEYDLTEKLLNGQIDEAQKLLDSDKKKNGVQGHYQAYYVYDLMLKNFDCLVFDKKEEGKKFATVFYNYCKIVKPKLIEKYKSSAFPNDDWRSQTIGIVSYQNIAYAYDFAYNYMTTEQKDYVRDLISIYSYGKLTMAMNTPPHFRNWNWVNVGQSLALNVIAIEGEKGFDKRVYKKCVENMQAFMDYGLSSKGSSREAVGYTSFGFYWAAPAMVAMARRGDNFLVHPHFRAMKDWYVHSLEPFGKKFTSHGDGGDGSPSLEKLIMMKYFYPKDAVIDYLYQNKVFEKNDDLAKSLEGNYNIILPLIFATDPDKEADGKFKNYAFGEKLNLLTTFFDTQRGSLNTRSGWNKESSFLEFECRIDGISPSHEHADRGNFTFSALGRPWALDGFRGVETKHHNNILINGKGQGFFPTPGKWIATIDKPEATFGICENKYAYDWRWPKSGEYYNQIGDSLLKTPRFKGFQAGVEKFRKVYGNAVFEKDPTSNVKNYYENFQDGKPKMWDEDLWPVRIPYNPVKKSFRTAGLVKGKHSYALIVDDIQKDDKENVYDWLMMLPFDLTIISMNEVEIILGADGKDDKIDGNTRLTSRKEIKGEPLLLVKILNRNYPSDLKDYESAPTSRLELIEKVTTLFGRDRTFGLDKRLVIPSLSVSPDFKIVLYPYYSGETLPSFQWNENKTVLTIDKDNEKDEFTFKPNAEGRTEISFKRNGLGVF